MTLFQTYIDTVFNGNQTLAAQALGVTRSMVSRMVRGQRNVSPALAKRAEEVSGGRFRKETFVWPELAVHTDKEPANSPPLPSLPAPTFSSSGRGALSQRAMVEAAA